VTPSHWQRTSAFGALNAPQSQVRENLRHAFQKAKAFALETEKPSYRGKYPLERLRRQFAHAMRMDVLFAPRVQSEYINSKWPNSRLPVRKVWDYTPVWKTADSTAYQKANRLCNVLHYVALIGWKANITHDLVRLATYAWQMSLRDFYGLCRKIVSKILKRSTDRGSMPDPAVRNGPLTAKPTIMVCDIRIHPEKSVARRLRRFRTSKMFLALSLLNSRQYRVDLKRVQGPVRSRLFT
jgi:hypothetical protein